MGDPLLASGRLGYLSLIVRRPTALSNQQSYVIIIFHALRIDFERLQVPSLQVLSKVVREFRSRRLAQLE
jgi:hypothetical protein